MSSFRNSVALALIFLVLATATSSTRTATAAPNGKTSTNEIAIGLGVIYEFARYTVDRSKTAGSVRQAAGVMVNMPDSTDPLILVRDKILFAAAHNLTTATTVATTDTMGVPKKQWSRLYYENLRTCWNQAIAAAKPASPDTGKGTAVTPPDSGKGGNQGGNQKSDGTDSGTAVVAGPNQPKAVPTTEPIDSKIATTKKHPRNKPPSPKKPDQSTPKASPQPKTTPQPPSCDAIIHDDLKPRTIPATIDLLDLTAALKSAPSVFQEVIDQNVGSFENENQIRAEFLQFVGVDFVTSSNPIGEKGLASTAPQLTDLNDVISKCYSGKSPFDCISKLNSFETELAKSQNQAAACSWSRYAWLPTYSAVIRTWRGGAATNLSDQLKLAPATVNDGSAKAIQSLNFGAPPGC